MTGSRDITQLVRALRERTGLTQEKFAAKLGVTFPTISRWENGRASPSPLALKQIDDLLANWVRKVKTCTVNIFKVRSARVREG